MDDVLVADPLAGGLKLQTGQGEEIDFTRKAFMEAAKVLPLFSREWRKGVIITTMTTVLPFPTNQR